MGKYIRKAKASSDVASMEIVPIPLGVCTRALRKQQMQSQGQLEKSLVKEYLELRSWVVHTCSELRSDSLK